MIDREKAIEVAEHVIYGLIQELQELEARGGDVHPVLADSFRMLHALTFDMGHPDAELFSVDLTEKAKQLPDHERWTVRENIELRFIKNGQGEVVFAYTAGESKGGVLPDGAFADALLEVIRDTMREYDVPEHVLTKLTKPSEYLLGKALKRQMDEEVEAFRKELDTNLDNLFRGGGEST